MEFLEELEAVSAGTLPQEVVVEDVIATTLQQTIEESVEPEESMLSKQFSEAEKRIEKAMLYRQFLSGDLFDGDSVAVQEVSIEFKDWAQIQLKKLLGIVEEPEAKAAPQQSLFSEEQSLALTALANAIISKPSLRSALLGKQETSQALQKPVEQKKSEVKIPPKKPQLRSRKLPQELQTKPTAPVETSQPTVQPPAMSIKPVVKPVQQQAKKKTIHQNDEVFEEGGRTYKAVWKNISTGQYGPVEENRIRNMKPDTAIMLKNGIVVVKDMAGDIYSIVNKDLTPKKPEPTAKPFPTKGQMAIITADQSNKAAEINDKKFTARAIGVDRSDPCQGTDFLGPVG